jgi:hypothetical protein
MKAEIKFPSKSLYEEDFYLWLLKTAGQLKERRLQDVDWDNLIEEIECMGRSERRAVESLLLRLIEHLLKLAYWDKERERNQNHWKSEILNFRLQIEALLKDSPSLKNHLQDFFHSEYIKFSKKVKASFGFDIPSDCPFSLEQVLDAEWFPNVREEQRED